MAIDAEAVVERKLAEVEAIAVELEGINERRESLYARRVELFEQLAECKVTHKEIAERAHVTKDAVSLAIFEVRKKRKAQDS